MRKITATRANPYALPLLRLGLGSLVSLSAVTAAHADPVVFDVVYGGVLNAPLEAGDTASIIYDDRGRQPRTLATTDGGVTWQFNYAPGDKRAVRLRTDANGSVATASIGGGLAKFDSSGMIRYHIPGVTYVVQSGGVQTAYVPVLDHKRSSAGLISTGQDPVIRYDYSTLGTPDSIVNQAACASADCQSEVSAYNMLWEGLATLDLGGKAAVTDNHKRLYDPGAGRFWHRDQAHQSPSPYVSRGDDPINMKDVNGNTFFRAMYERLTSRVGIVTSSLLTSGVGYYEYRRYHNPNLMLREQSRPRTEVFVAEQWIPPQHGGFTGDVKHGEDIPVSYMKDVFSYSGLPKGHEYSTWGGFAVYPENAPPQIRSIKTRTVQIPLSDQPEKRQSQVSEFVKNMGKTTTLLEQYSILSAFYHGGETDLPDPENDDLQVLIANFRLKNQKDFIYEKSDGIGEFGEALTAKFGGMTFIAPDIAQSIVAWNKDGWKGARKSVQQFNDQYSDRISSIDFVSPAGGIDWGQGGGQPLSSDQRTKIKSDYKSRQTGPEPSDDMISP